MRKTLALLVSLILTLSLAGCAAGSGAEPKPAAPSAQPVAEPVKVRAAYHPGLGGSIVPGIDSIEGNHFFQKHGIAVEWVKFTSGPPEVAAMVSNDIQFGYIGHGAHTLAAEGSINVIALSHVGNSERIFVRTDSGIEKLEDLRGKTVATQLGTSGEVILNLALARVNMTKEDLNVVNMDMAGAVAAFIAKQVDAIACWDVHATNVLAQVGEANIRTLASTSEFSDVTAFPASWVVTPAYLESNRDVVVRFIAALYDVYDYRAANYDASIKASAEFNEQTFEDFNQNRDTLVNYSSEQIKTMIDDGSLLEIYKLQLKYLMDNGTVERGDVNDYVRVDLMKEAFEKRGQP